MAGGGYHTSQGIMDQVASENDPNLQQTRTYYDPYASQSDATSASGLAAAAESVGLASGYRSPGYQVNRAPGYVGGNANASAAQLAQTNALGDQARGYIGQYQTRESSALGDSAGSRGLQSLAASSYLQTLNGQTPSIAQQQMMQGQQQALAAQASTAAGARGGGANLAAAQLAGATNAGQIAASTNQQAALLRANEYAAAQQGLGGLGGQMRAQDLQNAQLAQQGAGMQQQYGLGYAQLGQQQRLAEMNAQTQLEQTQGQLALQKQKQNADENQNSAKQGSGLLGGILGGLSGGLGLG